MRPLFIALCFALTLPAMSGRAAPAQAEESKPPVYVIPIRGMIEPALVYVIRRGLAEAETTGAEAIVFAMDTPGGAVNATEEIVKLLRETPATTYTFVEANAISAGAIIALGTDHIYMAPGSKIGDAMPIMMSPTGGMQPLPDAEREKITAYVDTLIRGVAEQKGHDKTLASAMVRRETEYEIDGEIISKEGQLLTLTNVEAERRFGPEKKPLLSEGTVESLEEMLDVIGLAGAEVVELEVTGAERFARFIAALAPLFLMAGLLGIYLEIKTPGIGLPGALGALSLALFFWGHNIAGLAGMEDVVIFAVGVLLLAAEVLLIPGFGLAGTAGLLLIVFALLNAMTQRLPGGPWYPTSWPQVEIPFITLCSTLVVTVVGAIIMERFLPKTSLFHRIVLEKAETREEGFHASRESQALAGLEGVPISDLRPAGTGVFGERRLDVVTRGEFIAAGTPIRIAETHGNRIIVETSDQES